MAHSADRAELSKPEINNLFAAVAGQSDHPDVNADAEHDICYKWEK